MVFKLFSYTFRLFQLDDHEVIFVTLRVDFADPVPGQFLSTNASRQPVYILGVLTFLNFQVETINWCHFLMADPQPESCSDFDFSAVATRHGLISVCVPVCLRFTVFFLMSSDD